MLGSVLRLFSISSKQIMSKNRSIVSFFGGNNTADTKQPPTSHPTSSEIPAIKREICHLKSSVPYFEPKISKPTTTTLKQSQISKTHAIPVKEYRPDSDRYDPIDDACWLPDQPIPFLALCLAFKAIEETSSTIKSTMIATNFFKSAILLSPDEFISCLYLCMSEIAPSYEGLKLGIGDSLLIQTIANSTGRRKDQIKHDLTEKGDLGIVAEESKVRQRTLVKPKDLTVEKVFTILREIAFISGDKANEKKCAKIQMLYSNCQLCESRYLIRILQKNLRIGLREPLILNAIAHAMVQLNIDGGKKPSSNNLSDNMKLASTNIRNAFCVLPNFGVLIPTLMEKGWEDIHNKCQINVGVPVKPMLAIPLNQLTDIYSRFGDNISSETVVFEYKYDGERAQIHYNGDSSQVSCFSRNQENQTLRYPEISQLIPDIFTTNNTVHSFIIDSEIVAYDNELSMIRPFQVLLTRKYKNVTIENIKVNVCVVAFDLLFLNGKSLLDTPLKERIRLLKTNFNQINSKFMFAKNFPIDKCNDENIIAAIDDAVKNQCEGLMVKDLSSVYQINKRSSFWIKLKKDYIDKVGDTVDLIVMGGYHGAGKRKGSYGGFLMGCYDPISEEVQSICRIGTGLSDAVLIEHYEFFKQHIVQNPPDFYRFDQNLAADHWFEPVQVWEIKAADMSLSTVHQAARDMIENGKGISLRFPRFIKIRSDKQMSDATDSSTIIHLYKSQASVQTASSNCEAKHRNPTSENNIEGFQSDGKDATDHSDVENEDNE